VEHFLRGYLEELVMSLLPPLHRYADDDDASSDAFDATLDWYEAAVNSGRGFKSEKERQDYIASLGDPLKHPMFATSTEDLADNPLAEAIRALREEDKTFVQLAIMYKDEGNELMEKKEAGDGGKKNGSSQQKKKEEEKKRIYEAFNNYSHSLTFLDKADDARARGVEDTHDDGVDLLKLRSQILGNRAMSSLALSNYGSCCRDAVSAILCWPQNVKAHYRKCKSLVMLRKFELALAACREAEEACFADAGPAPESNGGSEFAELRRKCETELKKGAELKLAKEKAADCEREKWANAWKICTDFQIVLGHSYPTENSSSGPQGFSGGKLSGKMPHYDQAEVEVTHGGGGSIREGETKSVDMGVFWPILFLYPQYNKLDAIQGASGEDMLAAHLAQMFPEEEDEEDGGGTDMGMNPSCSAPLRGPAVPWDAANEYHVSRLAVYLRLAGTPKITSSEEWILHCHELTALDEGTSNKGDDDETESTSMATKFAQRQQLHEKERCTFGIDDFVEIHMGCSLLQILTAPGHVLPGGLLTLVVYPRGNAAHQQFLQKVQGGTGKTTRMLLPTGAISNVKH